jgi:LacI family transcriptional regulator
MPDDSSRRPGDGAASPRRPVTLQDVARAAGVSVATASFVASGRLDIRVSESTRERVQGVIDDLGYRRNALAQTLKEGRSRLIGLVADAIATTPFAGQIIHGAQDEAWKHGYVLLIANTEGNVDVEREASGMMLEHRVHGVLYSTWFHRAADLPDELREADVVMVNCFSTSGGIRAVVPDERQGGRSATEALLLAGHERIAFINATTPAPAQTGRLQGYQDALAAAGVEFDPSLVLYAFPDQEGGYQAGEDVLATDATGVFCYNDRMAMGLYDRLRERGLSIPEDMSVVGFDNQEVIAAHLRPPLSTVGLPHYELGAAGIRVLLHLEDPGPDGVTVVACPPVPRASIVPPAAG